LSTQAYSLHTAEAHFYFANPPNFFPEHPHSYNGYWSWGC